MDIRCLQFNLHILNQNKNKVINSNFNLYYVYDLYMSFTGRTKETNHNSDSVKLHL